MTYLLGFLWSFLASAAFAILFNVRGRSLPFAALGGAIGWVVYLLSLRLSDAPIGSYFFASVTVALWSEVVARILRRPVPVLLVSSLMPLVPGGGLYYTMSESLAGHLDRTLHTGFETLSAAGAIAAGVAVASAISRLVRLAVRKE